MTPRPENKDLEQLIKLLKMTTSSVEAEAIVAMRKANDVANRLGSWETILRGKVTVMADPFMDAVVPTNTGMSRRPPPPSQHVPTPPSSQPPPWRASPRRSTPTYYCIDGCGAVVGGVGLRCYSCDSKVRAAQQAKKAASHTTLSQQRQNRFKGKCAGAGCRTDVNIGDGYIENETGVWRVWCRPCAAKGAKPSKHAKPTLDDVLGAFQTGKI